MTRGPTPLGITLIDAMLQAPLIAVSARWPKTQHAAGFETIAASWPDGTVAAECGAQHLRLLAQGDRLIPWPPPHRCGPGRERCRECWVATGRMRPRVRLAEATR